MIKGQIARLKKPAAAEPTPRNGDSGEAAGSRSETSGGSEAVVERLDKLEHLVQEMNGRLKSIETRLPPPKP
jgi:hypothetical protein